MNENSKNKILRETAAQRKNSQPENPAAANWQKDIETHDYYYDDSHGYEIYQPDDNDDETDED